MIQVENTKDLNEEGKLSTMNMFLKSQLDSENDDLANISNATSIIKASIDNLNWAGFYFMRENELVLGPFQGLPACNRIQIGSGVCGTAVESRRIQLVADVHLFPGHITCDFASNSELVIPIIKEDKVIGVLDLDSPLKDRFTDLHAKYFSEFVDLLNEYINWDKI